MTNASRLASIAGTCLTATLAFGAAGCSGEQAVSITDLPAAVRATLDKETAGGAVTELEKETKNGKVVYSADAKVDGKEWDITIAEDGTLISKEVEK